MYDHNLLRFIISDTLEILDKKINKVVTALVLRKRG